MGKSTAAALLAELGASVVDTDVIARQIVELGQSALAEIRNAFGTGVIRDDGSLCRDELARLVFSDAAERRKLEAILHPRIREIWLAQVERWRAVHVAVGVVVIPLLFETSAAGHFDATICVACTLPTQLQRLQARGWSREQIAQRSQAQWPADEKMKRSDFVVWTEGSLAAHREQLRRILTSLSLT